METAAVSVVTREGGHPSKNGKMRGERTRARWQGTTRGVMGTGYGGLFVCVTVEGGVVASSAALMTKTEK